MSKRKLLAAGARTATCSGWDDPRMPTIAGLRRRGYTPEAIRDFCERIGVAKADSVVDMALLEHCLREDLNRRAARRMAVLRPLQAGHRELPRGPGRGAGRGQQSRRTRRAGTRKVPFSRVLYIEQDDFREAPPPKYFRLAPGAEVRLRYAYFVKCTGVVQGRATGEVAEVRCTYDPATRGGDAPTAARSRGRSTGSRPPHAVDAEVRLYDTSSRCPSPTTRDDCKSVLNPQSLEVVRGARSSRRWPAAAPGTHVQFERLGYFVADWKDHRPDRPVFNRTVGLRDTWARIEKTAGA